MKTFINTGNSTKTYSRGFRPVVVHPRQCITSFQTHNGDKPPGLQEVGSFAEAVDKFQPKRICLSRSFAMGDVIMLLPVVRHIKSLFPFIEEIGVTTSHRFKDIVNACGGFVRFQSMMPRSGWDLSMALDGLLEVDHLGGEQSNIHRIDLYCDALGLAHIKRTKKNLREVWSFPEVLESSDPFHGEAPVAIQWSGSTACKTLSEEIRDHLFREVAHKYPVLTLDAKAQHPAATRHSRDFADSPLSLAKVLHHCRASVTMDSGPLWLSHVAQVPTLALLGPTRSSERTSMHPAKVSAIQMEKSIGCTPCFEKAEACQGAYSCMRQVNKDWLAKKVIQALGRLTKAPARRGKK